MNERKRVNIKAILVDPVLRKEIVEGATDFICKVEGIKLHSLSPAAQAVLDAAINVAESPDAEAIAAAALKAAADQVAPSDAMEPRNHIPMALECQRIRKELLAIADELEGVKYGTYRCDLKT